MIAAPPGRFCARQTSIPGPLLWVNPLKSRGAHSKKRARRAAQSDRKKKTHRGERPGPARPGDSDRVCDDTGPKAGTIGIRNRPRRDFRHSDVSRGDFRRAWLRDVRGPGASDAAADRHCRDKKPRAAGVGCPGPGSGIKEERSAGCHVLCKGRAKAMIVANRRLSRRQPQKKRARDIRHAPGSGPSAYQSALAVARSFAACQRSRIARASLVAGFIRRACSGVFAVNSMT